MTIGEVKQTLRQQARTARDALDAAERQAAAMAIAARAGEIAALSQAPQPVVTSYFAIGSELDPAPLVGNLQGLGARAALPVMTRKAAPLEFRAWCPGAPLVAREWGIRQPGPECPLVTPDILLVPLLLVDIAGNRLGYGGGFYDRTLAALRQEKRIVAIGIAYECQRVDAVPHEAYDEPLHYLLTPERFVALQ